MSTDPSWPQSRRETGPNGPIPIRLSRPGGAVSSIEASDQGISGEWNFAGIDRALSGRLTIWETAGRMIADRPLAGVGAGAFRTAYDRYSTRADDPYRSGGGYEGGVYHAHQLYISIAAESGIIGLSGVLLALFLGVKWYWTAPRTRRDAAWPFAFGLLVAVFPINSQPVIYTHWWFPILLLLLCAGLAALDAIGSSRPRRD